MRRVLVIDDHDASRAEMVQTLQMLSARPNHIAGKIFDNILFLAEVFSDHRNEDIPPLPILEMARCFELASPTKSPITRRRRRDWPLCK